MIECPVARSARLWPDREALIADGRAWSYSGLDDAVRRTEGFLSAEGIKPDDRVAVVAENCAELVVLVHAAARIGAPLALLHPRLGPAELRQQLGLIEPRSLFISGEAAPGAEGRPISTILSGASSDHPASLEPSRIQSILFTSGSTASAKAVALTVANQRSSALASGKNLGSDPDQRWLACLPLCHVGGLAIPIRAATYGAAVELMVYDTEAVALALAGGGITHLSLVPTMLARLIDRGAFRTTGGTLRAILVGGAPSDDALWDRARTLGLPVLRTYGLTEAASQVTAEKPGEFTGTCGRPLDGVQVRIVDPDRREVPAGAMGEIEVSGPSVMQGYYGDAEATRLALPDQWLRTRDLGSLDRQGRLTVAARRSDLILSGGENVAPAEIESVLLTHPQIAEAAVLPMPHRELGQVPLAVLVARGERPTEEALHAWCRARLAAFKCPRRWVFLDALPRNAVGKLDRSALRDALAELV